MGDELRGCGCNNGVQTCSGNTDNGCGCNSKFLFFILIFILLFIDR